MIDNEDLQYGSVEPDAYIAIMSFFTIIGVFVSFAVWLLIKLPYRLITRRRNA